MANENLPAITSEQLLTLYQDQLDRISEAKIEQWRVSHYGILFQAAITTISLKLHQEVCWYYFIFIVLSFVVTAVAITAIHQMQKRIMQRREALDDLSKLPKDSFDKVREDLLQTRLNTTPPNRWKHELFYASVFFGAQALGFVGATLMTLFGGASGA